MGKVLHCCIARGGKILYAYNRIGALGTHEMENLAIMCVERAPLYHKWYFQTMGRTTFGFLMEDGYVYLTIADHDLGNHGVLLFLEHLRDDFKKVSTNRGLKGSLSNLSSGWLKEQLQLMVPKLIGSTEHVSHHDAYDWNVAVSTTSSDSGEYKESRSSSKAPLLGKSGKTDRITKDHVLTVKDAVELEERRKSTDRGFRGDFPDQSSQGVSVSSMELQREPSGSLRRSASQSIRRKWCRQVRIIIAIDVAICLVLFVVWLAICRGFQCLFR